MQLWCHLGHSYVVATLTDNEVKLNKNIFVKLQIDKKISPIVQWFQEALNHPVLITLLCTEAWDFELITYDDGHKYKASPNQTLGWANKDLRLFILWD